MGGAGAVAAAAASLSLARWLAGPCQGGVSDGCRQRRPVRAPAGVKRRQDAGGRAGAASPQRSAAGLAKRGQGQGGGRLGLEGHDRKDNDRETEYGPVWSLSSPDVHFLK